MEAMQSYERAARLAGEHGFIQDRALAHELAGRCCLASDLRWAAQGYMREARDCYLQWGALSKAAQLDRLYPASKQSPPPVSRTTIEKSAEQLDIATVVKTAQAISSEMELGKLIETLMTVALEHAGAERGLLVLLRGDKPQIVAEAGTGHAGVGVAVREVAVAAD